MRILWALIIATIVVATGARPDLEVPASDLAAQLDASRRLEQPPALPHATLQSHESRVAERVRPDNSPLVAVIASTQTVAAARTAQRAPTPLHTVLQTFLDLSSRCARGPPIA